MVNRGYRSKRIQQIINTVKFEQRKVILTKPKQVDGKTNPLILATRYSDCSRSICNILKKRWHLFNSDATLSQLFPEPPMAAHKKKPSLNLFRYKLKGIDTETRMIPRSQTCQNNQTNCKPKITQTQQLFHHRTIIRPCGERNCILGAKLRDTCFIFSKTHKHRHYIRYEGPTMTCITKRVVYLLRCKRCNKQYYVGQTKKAS